MKLEDYRCPNCAHVLHDHRIDGDCSASAPICPACLTDQMEWIPQTRAMDVGGVKGAAFKAFETYDGQNKLVQVNNLRDLRRLERESEKMARDGIGQPIVFRKWQQGDSNFDVHTITPSWQGGEQPTPQAKKKFGETLRKSGSTKEGEILNREVDSDFGPGVNESNASALPDQ